MASCYCFLLLHYSGELLLNFFSAKAAVDRGGAQRGAIVGVIGKLLDVMGWPEPTWVG